MHRLSPLVLVRAMLENECGAAGKAPLFAEAQRGMKYPRPVDEADKP